MNLGAERPPVVHGIASVPQPCQQGHTLSAAGPVSHDSASVESLLACILRRLDCIEVTLKRLTSECDGRARTEAFVPRSTAAPEPREGDEPTSAAALELLDIVAAEPLRDDELTSTAALEPLNTVAAEPLKDGGLTSTVAPRAAVYRGH